MEEKRIFASIETIELIERVQEETESKTYSKTINFVLKEYFSNREMIKSLKGRIDFLEIENNSFKEMMYHENEANKIKELFLKMKR